MRLSRWQQTVTQPGPIGHWSRRRLLRPAQPLTQWLQWLANGVLVVGLLYLLAVERAGAFSEHYRVLAVVSVLLMVIVYHTVGVFRRYGNQWSGMARVAQVWLITCGLIILLGFLTKTSHHYSRQVLVFWFATSLVGQCAVYALFHMASHVFRSSLNVRLPAVVVGSGWLAERLISCVNRNVFLADQVIGVVDRPEHLARWHNREVPAMGNLSQLGDHLQDQWIERVYIALPLDRANEVPELHRTLQRFNVDLIWVPDIFSIEPLNPSVREVAGMPLISLSESPLTAGGRAYLKSLMDVVGALAALLLLSPVMVAAALAIKLTSRGPAIYRQTRSGWDRSTFRIWKFRTMYVHDEGPGVVTQACRHDDRITPVGRFLRRTSIDELPQLFNVLSGSMSLVGPRPHSLVHDDEYARHIEAYMRRHRIKPGMTGWAQVHGYRGETRDVEAMRKRVEYDVDYINRWSLWLDVWILCRTPLAVCSRNAY